jgi:hypothetical protein
MARSFQPIDLVQLPTLNARGAIALATSLVTAGKASRLPKPAETALAAVETKLEVLRADIGPRERPDPDESPEARKADLGEDRAFGALRAWLAAFARLPPSFESGQKARALIDLLFAEGLKFTHWAYKMEWAECDAILAQIASEKHDTTIVALGGADFLGNARAAHEAYGKALGVTSEMAPAAPVPSVREHLGELVDAIRLYVVRVSGLEEPGDAASAEQVKRLLRPISEWPDRERPAPGPSSPPSPPPA